MGGLCQKTKPAAGVEPPSLQGAHSGQGGAQSEAREQGHSHARSSEQERGRGRETWQGQGQGQERQGKGRNKAKDEDEIDLARKELGTRKKDRLSTGCAGASQLGEECKISDTREKSQRIVGQSPLSRAQYPGPESRRLQAIQQGSRAASMSVRGCAEARE